MPNVLSSVQLVQLTVNELVNSSTLKEFKDSFGLVTNINYKISVFVDRQIVSIYMLVHCVDEEQRYLVGQRQQ